MELSPREEQILSSIVEFCVSTGDPVGSKLLADVLPFAVSSATIRNEMAMLCSIGLLEQPHTSAGRIPSYKGYRYYIDNLMPGYSPSGADIFRIMNGIDINEGDPVRLIENACSMLYEITGLTSVATTPYSPSAVIRDIRAVPVSSNGLMIIVTTSAGVLKSRIAKLDREPDIGTLNLFYRIAASQFEGIPVEDVTAAKIQCAAASLQDSALEISPLLVCLYEACAEAGKAGVIIKGQKELLNGSIPAEKGEEITAVSTDEELFAELLTGAGRQRSGIRLGAENGHSCFSHSAVITAPYKTENTDAGVIGVIGPLRMAYSKVIPIVNFTGETLSRLLNTADGKDN